MVVLLVAVMMVILCYLVMVIGCVEISMMITPIRRMLGVSYSDGMAGST